MKSARAAAGRHARAENRKRKIMKRSKMEIMMRNVTFGSCFCGTLVVSETVDICHRLNLLSEEETSWAVKHVGACHNLQALKQLDRVAS